MTKDLTQGKPLRLILAFWLPVLMGNLFQQFYNIADTIIIGRFEGVQALAAVGSTGSLNFLVLGFATGMCSGFSIPVARYFGAKDMPSLRNCIANLLYLSLIIAVVLTTAVLLLTRQMLTWMHTPDDIYESAYRYIFIIFAGISITVAYNVLANIARALGDSRTPLYFLIVASLLNIGLDILFVVVFHMSTAGVAYATIIAQAIAAIACFLYMARRFPQLKLSRGDMKWNPMMIRYLLNMGFPMALQFSITAIGSITIQSAVNLLGSTVVASVTAAGKVLQIMTQPMEALCPAVSTFSSQNLGARKLDRVEAGVRCALMLAVFFGLAMGVVTVLFGANISRMFLTGANEAMFQDIHQYLAICGIFYVFLGILLVLRNAIQGLGYGFSAMMAGIFELVARGVVAMVFVSAFGFWAVCFANPAAWIAANILLVPLYIHVLRVLKKRNYATYEASETSAIAANLATEGPKQ